MLEYLSLHERNKSVIPFKIHILGCGSALPTLRHNATCQIVEIRGKFFMIDCGEGTQIQVRRTKVHFTKIQAVLFHIYTVIIVLVYLV